MSLRILLLCCTLFFVQLTHGQIQVGSNKIGAGNRPGRLDADALAALRTSTTVFTLPDADTASKEVYEAAIAKVWTVSKFVVASRIAGMRLMNQPGYTAFVLGGWIVERRSSSGMTSYNTHLAYDLISMKRKGDKKVPEYFARIMLHPDVQTMLESQRRFSERDAEMRMSAYLYQKASFSNLNAGFLAGYLKTVNDQLEAAKERGGFDETTDNMALKALATDTLLVPDYVLVKMNMFSGDEHTDEGADEDLAKVYPYPVKVLPAAVISRRILNSSRPVYYLVYTRSSTDKYINVYQSGTGKLLYAQYSPLSYNFKYKDLSRLAKAIR